jgi:sugar lactone lactonase YvrE
MGTAAKFAMPNDIAIDASGNLYVSDGMNNRIRKITPAGMVSTLAGDAGNLILYQPIGLDLDAAGNVYVADWGHNRIRKITPGGVVSTFAGCDNCVGGYVDGPGTAARFWSPTGVTVDGAGNVYVTEVGNHVIRKISPAGVVSTYAGSVEGFADGTGAAAKFYKPISPVVDAVGNIYLADVGNNRIRKITPAGEVSTLTAGVPCGNTDGPIATALFCNPLGVAIDAAGNLYISDTNNERIRKISAQ